MRSRVVALFLSLAALAGPSSALGAAPRSPAISPPTPAPAPASEPGDACRKMPAGKRLKLNLKPNTEVVDLVSWISAITCKRFIVPGNLPAQGKTVTIVAPQPITAAEAYDLFLDALDSVGLTVYSAGRTLRLIETSKIKSAPIPVYIDGED
jgi:type II secretory pathway component GspD/PulD (secretin)